MTCARSLIIKFSATFTPRLASISISASKLGGFSTTPEAITHCTCGPKMPLGTSESLKVWPPRTTVCPALAPP